ncbi:MAG: prepilin-type N-terminal cleavage/methylation domain-containing protein, partial [Candidatus Marinimicrobia bacterium]|nr:prepilin-type N-terminal cleavage/methylation domain-containing protein [Candidatus Neomarinimicrobiota bacterium]MCF7840725.1 prepilin-type N-terminal cleavage/methylation domain-containing protein [Candidatus Neomarinimicrobiota bacterium]
MKWRLTNQAACSGGFTLVESMIATVLLAVIL